MFCYKNGVLRMAVIGLVASMAPGSLTAADAAAPGDGKRPNFVFFLIDDLRHDALGCTGHPFVKTPNIDQLAASGVRFTNAFVTTSLCAPSRATFLTGTYSHTNGVRTNENQEFDESFKTFPQLLQTAGYETAFIGKWHMKPVSGPRPGFDYWLSFRGQGVYIDPELNENGRLVKAEGYMTDLLTGAAVEFVKRPREKPFSLCLWHKAVHGPFTPAERHKDLYADQRLPEPPGFRDDFKGKPQWQRENAWKRAKSKNRPATEPMPESIPTETWGGRSQQTLDYFRALTAVDDSVGQVVAALRETGKLGNTVIIFAGDNGFFHGEHRRGDKRLAYEESIRIPLLMCGPGLGKAGRPVEQMVLNLDMAPTILEMAGVEPPAQMQGRSLVPVLAGKATDWRKSFFYTYCKEEWLPNIPSMLGVRTTDWKYVRYPEIHDVDELYDLARDPHELHNLANDPTARDKLADMRRELDRLMKESGYTPPPGN